MLAELYEYAFPENEDNQPSDWKSTALTREYLMACNQLFEKGFLSHEKITKDSREAMESIHKGMEYVFSWYRGLSTGEFMPTYSKERQFLSWQTFDLLRIAAYGFEDFLEAFFEENPNYYVLPLKLNGSAVETLFSQFKYESHGKLTSANYSTARKTILLKKDIHGSAKAARGYRKTLLYIRDKKLQRKKR